MAAWDLDDNVIVAGRATQVMRVALKHRFGVGLQDVVDRIGRIPLEIMPTRLRGRPTCGLVLETEKHVAPAVVSERDQLASEIGSCGGLIQVEPRLDLGREVFDGMVYEADEFANDRG